MFSGIIQEIGQINKIETRKGKLFTIFCVDVLDNVKLGDSIAVNGACQTVTEFDNNSFQMYTSQETLSVTNLNLLKQGDYVNLEKPLSLQTLLDGHLVQGHVDGTGILKEIKKNHEEYILRISCPDNILKYLIYKGSVAVDGISLTINKVLEDGFLLTIIPLTVEKTILKYRKTGDLINLEVDLFAKYVEKLLGGSKNNNGLTTDFLKEHGFS